MSSEHIYRMMVSQVSCRTKKVCDRHGKQMLLTLRCPRFSPIVCAQGVSLMTHLKISIYLLNMLAYADQEQSYILNITLESENLSCFLR